MGAKSQKTFTTHKTDHVEIMDDAQSVEIAEEVQPSKAIEIKKVTVKDPCEGCAYNSAIFRCQCGSCINKK